MSKVIEKLKNVGPGALVAAGFVGPGTVTTCTVSGARAAIRADAAAGRGGF